MTPQEYQNYVRRMQKKSPLGKDMALAFLIGGLICAAGQGILNGWLAAGLREEDAAAATSISLVFLSALLTALNLYNKLARFGGRGHARANHGLCQRRRLPRHRLPAPRIDL